jgi:hypothetical protein
MAVKTVGWKGGNNDQRGPSPRIWQNCNVIALREDPNLGIVDGDDFLKFPPHGSTSGGAVSGALGNYSHYIYQGGGIADANVQGGALAFSSDGDNEGAALHTYAAPFKLTSTLKRFWFEARFKTSTIADTKHGIFVGLCESLGLSTAQPLDTAGAVMDKNLIGFHRLEGDGDKLDIVWKADGQTAVTLLADAVTLVADTFVKVGFTFDPDRETGKRLIFYYDGTEITTYGTGTQMAAVTFPSDICLGFIFGVMNATASTPGNSTLDWWQAAQEF